MKAQYRVAGVRGLMVQYGGNIFSLKLNFKTHLLADRLRGAGIRGVQWISHASNSLLIDFDPSQISADDLIRDVRRLEESGEGDREVLRSRLIRIPLVYGDRWTRACAEKFGVAPNLESVAEYNGMSIEELVHIHSTTTFWVLYVGFTPGLTIFVPIDPAKRITAPKDTIPRTWTPDRTLAIGGILNSIYSVESPGGYQMLGRTPLLVYDLERRNPIFERDIVLFKPSDRIIFEPITHEEYLAIERDFSSYQYQIEEEDWTIDRFLD